MLREGTPRPIPTTNEIINHDREHRRLTANGIKVYERTFHQPQEELLRGDVLNIGDPFRVIARTHRDRPITTVDYEFPNPETLFPQGVPKRIAELDQITDDPHIEGPFPEATKDLPDESFDRILAHAAMSMHSFEIYGDENFRELWAECTRLLKLNGRCYIGPVESDFGGYGDDRIVRDQIAPTLNELRDKGAIDYRIVYDAQPYEDQYGDHSDFLVPLSPDVIVIEKLGANGNSGLDQLFPHDEYEPVDSFEGSARIARI